MKKTLPEYLDKNIVRINNSPKNSVEACVFILITEISTVSRKKNILLLIYENFRNIGKAKWYIIFNVRTVFYKIKITEKDEWMIALRIKYGLFEWSVIPFGLANAF